MNDNVATPERRKTERATPERRTKNSDARTQTNWKPRRQNAEKTENRDAGKVEKTGICDAGTQKKTMNGDTGMHTNWAPEKQHKSQETSRRKNTETKTGHRDVGTLEHVKK